jgi:hypothetical protein
MPDLTQLLNTTGSGDPDAAAQLFELVYEDLRRLAAHRLAHEPPRQTLQPTALVHEAYLRLVGEAHDRHWDGRATVADLPAASPSPSWAGSSSPCSRQRIS